MQAKGLVDPRLVQELDYEREAATQRAFVDAFADDSDIVVPAVLEARPRVLISAWVHGRPLADVITGGTPEQRDVAGLRLLRLLLSSPARAGRIHGDPHPGNFRLLADGRLAVLDFGSSELMAAGWPIALGGLLRAARERDAEAVHGRAVSVGVIAPDAVAPATLVTLLDPWLEPLRVDRFHFDRSWLQRQVRAWPDPRSAGARLQRKVRIPTHHLLVQRVAFGLLGVLTSLDATVEVRAEVERWIPGLR